MNQVKKAIDEMATALKKDGGKRGSFSEKAKPITTAAAGQDFYTKPFWEASKHITKHDVYGGNIRNPLGVVSKVFE